MIGPVALLPGEQVVLSVDKDTLLLTTKRVRFNSVIWGQSNFISITLASVASCGLVTRSFPMFLLIGSISLIAGFAQGGDAAGAFIGIGVFLIIAYFVTRRAIISIASNGGQVIQVPVKGMNREAVVAFIEAVEKEKLG